MRAMVMSASASLLAAWVSAPAFCQTPLWQIDGPTPNAQLGYSLAAAGDVNGDGVDDVLVGSPGAGLVQVLSGTDGAMLVASTSSQHDYGTVVSGGVDIDADGVPDFAVGAAGGYQLGGVTVLSGEDGSVLFDVFSGCAFMNIGQAIAMLGDVTGDGIADVAIADGGDGIDTGGITTLWHESPVTPGSAAASMTFGECDCWCADVFGYAISGTGDVDGDGFPDLALSDTFQGLLVYGMPQGTLLYKHPLITPYSYESLGPPHVAGIGDVDQDGLGDVAALARINIETSWLRVYTGPTGTLAYTFATTADRVVGVGDADRDGRDDFLLGAPMDDTVGTNAGAAFLHSGRDGALLASYFGQAAGDRFGAGIAALGDVDGDGVGDIAIAAPDAGMGSVSAFSSPGGSEPLSYCTAKTNSLGCTPHVDCSGSPSLSGADDFLILSRDVLAGKPGLFFWGKSGPIAIPFLGGTLCVQPGLTRTPVQNALGPSGCDGGYAFHFSQTYMAAQGLSAGDTVNGQFWTRDPAHPDGTGVGLTDAIQFDLWP